MRSTCSLRVVQRLYLDALARNMFAALADIAAKNKLPLLAELASNRAVKTSHTVLSVAICGMLLPGIALSQTPSDPPPSSIVSPSSGSIQPETIQPGTPATNSSEENSIVADPANLLPDLPAVPKKDATLVGGTVERLDRVRDQVTVRVFGGGKVSALFDPRTHVYRGTKEVTIADLKPGERIYLDTILDGTTVFAKNIRLNTEPAAGETQGILVKYTGNDLIVRDSLSPTSVRIRLSPATKFMRGTQSIPASALVPGSLISVAFDAQGNGHDTARTISILALPGTRYTFVGQVVHIDLRTGLLVVNSSIDHKTYELYLDPSVTPNDNLQPGVNVTVLANFENARYVARSVTIDSQSQ
jgi:hypothetical protein